MYTGKLVFAQVMEHIPMKVFRRYVQTYNGNHKIKSFSCLDQYSLQPNESSFLTTAFQIQSGYP
jgi:hypothetical protein